MSYTKLFAREYTVQYADVCLRMASPEIKEHIPLVSKTFSWFPENGNEVLCQETNDWHDFLQEVEKRYQHAEAQKQFIDVFHRYGNEYVSTARQLGSLRFSKLTNEQMAEYYGRYFSIWVLYTAYLWVSFVLNDTLAVKGQNIIAKKNALSADAIAVLLSPSKKSGILLLQERFSKLKKQGVETLPDNVVAEVLKEYAWTPCLDLQNDPWKETNVQEFYNELVVVEELQMTFDEAAEEAKLLSEERILFQRIKDAAYIKDMRDFYRRMGIYVVLPFFDALGKRLGVTRKEIAYFTHDELIAALEGKTPVSLDIVNARKKEFLMYWQDDQIVITTNKKSIGEFEQHFIEESQKEIKGVIASRGIVKGTVKIIRGVQDLNKVAAGDILVAITTHPNYVPAMHRASAFVTDEGGLTSHAAIVSREMKKPCIVGAKTATQQLRDGDLVEVDANNGIVRKL